MRELRLGAIILAGGLSSRMQGFKPLLQIGEKTAIEHGVTLFLEAGVTDIVTVLGYRADELTPLVKTLSSRCVFNGLYLDGMFSSVRAGVRALPQGCDAFYLLPVDIPLVQPATLQQLSEGLSQDPSLLVCYPCFQSKRGHPPLISAGLAKEIIAYDGKHGMRGYLRKYNERSLNILVDDPFVVMDVDTQEDLAALRNAYKKMS